MVRDGSIRFDLVLIFAIRVTRATIDTAYTRVVRLSARSRARQSHIFFFLFFFHRVSSQPGRIIFTANACSPDDIFVKRAVTCILLTISMRVRLFVGYLAILRGFAFRENYNDQG